MGVYSSIHRIDYFEMNFQNFFFHFHFTVKLDDEDKVISAYSSYFETMTGGPIESSMSNDASILNTVTQVLCGMIILCLVLISTLFIWHRYSKTAAQGDEVISLRDSLRFVCCLFGVL